MQEIEREYMQYKTFIKTSFSQKSKKFEENILDNIRKLSGVQKGHMIDTCMKN